MKTPHLRAVAFGSATTAIAVGDDGTILLTSDGGATWTRRAGPAGLAANLQAVAFGSATTAIAVGDDGTILVTTDGGASWNRQRSPS